MIEILFGVRGGSRAGLTFKGRLESKPINMRLAYHGCMTLHGQSTPAFLASDLLLL